MRKTTMSLLLVFLCTFLCTESVLAEPIEDRIAALEKRISHLEQLIETLLPAKDTVNDSTIEKTEYSEKQVTLMDEQQFLQDIVASYNERSIVATKHTNAEINVMTNAEYVAYSAKCAEAERPFFEKYQNARFKDLNIQYLCSQYIVGLSKQYNSQEIWNTTNNYDMFINEYNSGYYNRAYVIVELDDYYDVAFGDISSMKVNVRDMDATNDAEKRNSQVSSHMVKETQELLNGIGFFCGSADGVAGKRTVKSIKRFQEMYGYAPIDGMIDEELIDQLTYELSQK